MKATEFAGSIEQPAVRILSATPCYDDTVTISYHRSMLAMTAECQANGYHLANVHNKGFPSQARNLQAAIFMSDPQFTHFLAVDADMGFPQGLLTRLIEADKDIIGATYPMRQLQERPRFIGGIKAGTIVNKGICPAIYVGCGFMLVKRAAMERMIEFHKDRRIEDEQTKLPVYDLFPSGAFEGVTITDDVGFCRLAKRAGLEIWADITTPLAHTGSVTFEVGSLADYVLPGGKHNSSK